MAEAQRAAVGSSGTVAAPVKTLVGRSVQIATPIHAARGLALLSLAAP